MVQSVRSVQVKATAVAKIPAVVGLSVLWLAVMMSALAVVNSTHQSRLLLGTLESLRKEASDLQVTWGQFLLEQSALAAYNRVEHMATEQLHMSVPEQSDIVMVKP